MKKHPAPSAASVRGPRASVPPPAKIGLSPAANRRPALPEPSPAVADPAKRGPRLQRATLERINLIHAAIKAVAPGGTRRVTRASLARDLEVSESTVKRDLDALVRHFSAPLKADFGRRTYYYADPTFELRPPIWLSPAEAGAVMLAIRSGASRAFPFSSGLQAAFAKIAPSLGGAVSLRDGLAAHDSMVSMPGEPVSDAECRHFELLRDAATRRHVVRIVYAKTDDAPPAGRLIHPLHLALRHDGCIVVAHAPEAGDRRNFDLSRISHAAVTGETFQPPKGFNLERYLAGGLDRFLGEPRHEITVRYSRSYFGYVRVHRWHPAQTFTELPDGRAESVFHVHHLREMMYFVLGAAGGAEVVSPAELRTMGRTAAATIAAAHGSG